LNFSAAESQKFEVPVLFDIDADTIGRRKRVLPICRVLLEDD
jgi:hypothetical protein